MKTSILSLFALTIGAALAIPVQAGGNGHGGGGSNRPQRRRRSHLVGCTRRRSLLLGLTGGWFPRRPLHGARAALLIIPRADGISAAAAW